MGPGTGYSGAKISYRLLAGRSRLKYARGQRMDRRQGCGRTAKRRIFGGKNWGHRKEGGWAHNPNHERQESELREWGRGRDIWERNFGKKKNRET